MRQTTDIKHKTLEYPLVSFIIPAYNAADTIVRCLDSIYGLSFGPEEFEIIVIDDASSDNTVEMVEAYSQPLHKGKGVQNLKLLKQLTNHRQGAARNRGVSVAKGEYICFVDADDVVAEGIVRAIRLAKEKQTDMVAFHCASSNEHGEIIREKEHLSFEDDEVFSGMTLQNRHPYWFSGPVAYVYDREFLARVDYPYAEGVLYEDSDFVVVHLYNAQRMVYSNELGYLAYERDGSTTRSTNYKNVADYLLLGVRMLRFYERLVNGVQCKVYGVENKEVEKFAEGILEGACWNVYKSTKRIIKLGNLNNVQAYYNRLDSFVDRKTICSDQNLHKYYVNAWTMICLKHPQLSIIILYIIIPLYRLVKR